MKAMSATKIIVGLNGALQKRFVLPVGDALVPGDVHRAASVRVGVGGKGQDAAIAMSCLSPGEPGGGGDPGLKLAQFVGRGSSGTSVLGLLLDALGEPALDGLTVRTDVDTRICTSVVASDETTELVEPSGTIAAGEMDELLRKLDGVGAAAPPPAALCIMGSMPPGCDEDAYAKIYEKAASAGTLCLVDSVAGIGPLLAEIAAAAAAARDEGSSGPPPPPATTVFKVNASELCRLAGCRKSRSESGGATLDEVSDAVRLFRERYPASRGALLGLAITDGRHPAYFASFGGTDGGGDDDAVALYRIPVPALDPGEPLFPIGAGDAVAGGTLAAWLCLTNGDKGATLTEECWSALRWRADSNGGVVSDPAVNAAVSAFSFGLACGSSSCLQEENSVLDPADVADLLRRMGSAELLASKTK